LAKSVKKPANHPTQERQQEKAQRKLKWLPQSCACFGFAAMRASNGHAEQTPHALLVIMSSLWFGPVLVSISVEIDILPSTECKAAP
jgi:hypothetical protein